MLDQWLFIGLFVLIVAVFPGVPILLAGILAPHKSSREKSETYECGMQAVGNTWVQFRIQYYVFALTFLVFDVELVFLFPWAVAFKQLTLFGVFSGVIFVLILLVELLAAWRKGVLEWA
jgi:NADH-quinone oxidoreductase subunit A